MEHQFDKDDFEHYLKDTVDEFRMYPSKRVWTSLYNNLHPARKWPSLAISLLLISSMVYIGYSHKNEIGGQSSIKKQELPIEQQQLQLASVRAVREADRQVNTIYPASTNGNANTIKQRQVLVDDQVARNTATPPTVNDFLSGEGARETDVNVNAPGSNAAVKRTSRTTLSKATSRLGIESSEAIVAEEDVNEGNGPEFMSSAKSNVTGAVDQEAASLGRFNELAGIPASDKVIRPIVAPVSYLANRQTQTRDIEWMEDFAFHNQPGATLKSRLQYEWYLTPSVGFRTYEKNINYTLPARSSILGAEENSTLQHHVAFNLEAGYSIVQQHSKRLRLKAGVQLNYTNYKINAHQQGHSSTTTLLLNDPYSGGFELKQKSSTIANRAGAASDDKLNNSTFQLSLPVGADVKIAGKQKIQWYVGATIQPSYTLFGNAYLISADMKNYVYDSEYLRKFNLNAGVETFLSYRMQGGVTFKAGPQFRYQLFSTYDKEYSYTEHLYNLGIKVGMVRNF